MAARTPASGAAVTAPRTVSVIVPVLDEAEAMPGLLADVSRLGAHQVVIADGGSTDGSAALAARAPVELLTAPRGRAAQMNAGAGRASGEVLLFLHADTRLPADAITQVCAAVDAGARWGRFDVRLDDGARRFRVIERAINLRSAASGIATGDQAMFVRADAFHAVGGFPDVALMEDVALSRRLRALARPARLRGPAVTSARKWRREGTVRTVLRMWLVRTLFTLGVPASRLHRLYYRDAPKPPRGVAR